MPVHADEVDDLRDEVQQLKQQVTLMQNQLPGAGAGGSSGGGTVAAQQEVRMQQLQQQLQQLQGQIEQLGIKVDDFSTRLDRMQKDSEFRLGRLEQGGAGGAMTGGAPMAGNVPAAGSAPAAAAPAQGPAPLPQSADQMGAAANTGGGLVGPEGTQQVPEPTAPGTLGTISQNTPLPQAPAGAAEAAAAAAAAASQPPAPAAAANQDPNSIVLPGNSPQEQYDYATGLLQRGAYPEAELAFKAFVSQHPKDPLAGNAQYWLGETYYARSDYKGAASAFALGYQRYKTSPKAPDNLLKLGMSLGQTGQKDNACLAFKQLAKEYPKASAAIKDRAARAQQRYGCTG
jgi:tol-pal system protein YbgF